MDMFSQLSTELEALQQWFNNLEPYKPSGKSDPNNAIETGKALKEIRDRKLYRETDNDFYIYCLRKWGFMRERVDRYIALAENKPIPKSVSPLPPQERESYVYFISSGDLVKIGVSLDVHSRLSTLQIGSPVRLSLLGFVAGNENLERQLHKRFDYIRTHGEWFMNTKELSDFIQEVCE